MPIYSVIVWGRNCLIELEGRVQRMGFYATRFYEVADEAEARRLALASVGAELADVVLNTPDALPVLGVDEVNEVAAIAGPNKGRAWYAEGDDA